MHGRWWVVVGGAAIAVSEAVACVHSCEPVETRPAVAAEKQELADEHHAPEREVDRAVDADLVHQEGREEDRREVGLTPAAAVKWWHAERRRSQGSERG